MSSHLTTFMKRPPRIFDRPRGEPNPLPPNLPVWSPIRPSPSPSPSPPFHHGRTKWRRERAWQREGVLPHQVRDVNRAIAMEFPGRREYGWMSVNGGGAGGGEAGQWGRKRVEEGVRDEGAKRAEAQEVDMDAHVDMTPMNTTPHHHQQQKHQQQQQKQQYNEYMELQRQQTEAGLQFRMELQLKWQQQLLQLQLQYIEQQQQKYRLQQNQQAGNQQLKVEQLHRRQYSYRRQQQQKIEKQNQYHNQHQYQQYQENQQHQHNQQHQQQAQSQQWAAINNPVIKPEASTLISHPKLSKLSASPQSALTAPVKQEWEASHIPNVECGIMQRLTHTPTALSDSKPRTISKPRPNLLPKLITNIHFGSPKSHAPQYIYTLPLQSEITNWEVYHLYGNHLAACFGERWQHDAMRDLEDAEARRKGEWGEHCLAATSMGRWDELSPEERREKEQEERRQWRSKVAKAQEMGVGGCAMNGNGNGDAKGTGRDVPVKNVHELITMANTRKTAEKQEVNSCPTWSLEQQLSPVTPTDANFDQFDQFVSIPPDPPQTQHNNFMINAGGNPTFNAMPNLLPISNANANLDQSKRKRSIPNIAYPELDTKKPNLGEMPRRKTSLLVLAHAAAAIKRDEECDDGEEVVLRTHGEGFADQELDFYFDALFGEARGKVY